MTSGPWAFCECIGELEKCSNLLYRFIFRESLAKVLLKPWRKTAFIWRLGGLNCGLAKASLQEYCSLGVEVSELADEGEQGPTYYAKTSNLNVQHCAATTEKLRWLICPRSCSILAWCTAKVKHGYGESLAKVILFSEDVLFRVKEFRTTLICYVLSLFVIYLSISRRVYLSCLCGCSNAQRRLNGAASATERCRYWYALAGTHLVS